MCWAKSNETRTQIPVEKDKGEEEHSPQRAADANWTPVE